MKAPECRKMAQNGSRESLESRGPGLDILDWVRLLGRALAPLFLGRWSWREDLKGSHGFQFSWPRKKKVPLDCPGFPMFFRVLLRTRTAKGAPTPTTHKPAELNVKGQSHWYPFFGVLEKGKPKGILQFCRGPLF